MSEVIATVRLAPGQVGYYDELSRVHLTIGMPEKAIYAGTNVTQLRRSVKSGRLILVNGTFGEERSPFKLVKKGDRYYLATNNKANSEKQPEVAIPTKAEEVAPVVEEKAAPVEEPVIEETVAEETTAVEETQTTEEAPVVEEAPVAEETPAAEEAPVEEETSKKKKTTKKKAAKKAE